MATEINIENILSDIRKVAELSPESLELAFAINGLSFEEKVAVAKLVAQFKMTNL